MGADNESKTAIALVDPLVGTIFDKRFRIERRIAQGGFGAIYRATHVKSGHPIALKVLLPALAQDLGVVARFRREGDTLTALRNPHTISAYELGQAGDRTLFIVMELLSGESLFAHYQANGPLEWKRMTRIARQVCESLAEAHALGIIHRDLKPTNIHLEAHDGDPDFVKVLDFGIAKILRGSEGFDASDITNAGTMIGTLDYMSPEQMVGGAVTGQTDIYTLGIVMYEMMAGTRPFPEAETAASALAAMLKTTPQPLYLRAPVSEEISRIVMRCLDRDTARRYKNVDQLMADLDRMLATPAGIADTTKMVELDARAKVAAARRTSDDDDDATTITPPPEKALDALRTPKVELRAASIDVGEAATVAAAVRDDIAADAARDAADDDDDDDEYAPRSTRHPDGTDELRRGASRRADPAERAATLPRDSDQLDARTPTNPRSGRDAHDRTPTNPRDSFDAKTPTVRRETAADVRGGAIETDAPRGKSATRPPPTPELDARHKPPTQPPPSPQPAARPLASRHIPTPVPQVVVAPFSSTPRAPGVPTPMPGSVPPGVPLPTPPGMPAASPPTLLGPPPPGGSSYGPGAPPPLPTTPSPRSPAPTPPGPNPFAGQGPGSNPFAQSPGSNPFAQSPGSNPFAVGPGSNPVGAPLQNPYGIPSTPQPRVQYDMGTLAAREAALRRWIWIIALVVAAGVAVLIAMRF